jgi:transposase InsO family protein
MIMHMSGSRRHFLLRIDIKTRPRHPESNGIVERFNGTVRDETTHGWFGFALAFFAAPHTPNNERLSD